MTVDGSRVSDEKVKVWLLELLEGEEEIYGYRLLAHCIEERYGVILNPKKAYRLCQELRILQKPRARKTSHPRRLPKNQSVTAANQQWQMDIKYGYAWGEQRFFFILSIIDVFDRMVVGQYRGRVCEAKHVVQTLWHALQNRKIEEGKELVIRTDNGPQFTSHLFGDTCESLELIHERIPPRTPNMNAYIESFHSLLERHLMGRRRFETLEEAYEALDRYMDFYNNRRLHGSLRRMAPAVFSTWIQTQEDTSDFHLAL